jgi:large subunit ribosomal protein L21
MMIGCCPMSLRMNSTMFCLLPAPSPGSRLGSAGRREDDFHCISRRRWAFVHATSWAVASGARKPISTDTMFAVIRTGGKQYKVAKDDVISVEKLAAEPGGEIELNEVLMIGHGAEVATGAPLVDGASVSAVVVEQTRADKIILFKKKRRHNYRRKKGHRQHQTVLRITDIRGANFRERDEGAADGA